MKFAIVIKTDIQKFETAQSIHYVSEELKAYFADKDYGEDVKDYLLGMNCFRPDYYAFFKDRDLTGKPVYVDHRISKNRFTGQPTEMNKLCINTVKLEADEYAAFIQADETERQRLTAQKILQSLSNLDKTPKKMKRFDKERFKQDMKDFLFRKYGVG